MTDLHFQFQDESEALSELASLFETTDEEGKSVFWEGQQTYSANNMTLAVVYEPVKLDEQGEPLPPTWQGFNVNVYLSSEDQYDGSLDKFLVHPLTPSNVRA